MVDVLDLSNRTLGPVLCVIVLVNFAKMMVCVLVIEVSATSLLDIRSGNPLLLFLLLLLVLSIFESHALIFSNYVVLAAD